VFSIFPSALAFYTGNSPCIFRTDTCLESLQEISEIYGNYGRIPFSIMRWMEKQAINKSKVILVVSKWTRDEIIKKHKIEESKVKLIPMASALPLDMTPVELQNEIKKSIHNPIQLLLVGRNYYGKGVDIAIDAVNILNEKGIPCKLTVCGCSGENNNFVEFVGPFSKSNSEELEKYIDLYKNADILIHPSRYDGAGIVPAEAAAFAVPTITNDVGGLSTTVTHNETGIVLPNSSPSEKYAETIIRLINEPEFYRKLSLGARKKFEDEQNWFVVGEIVDKIIKNS
jgi:glycosyltransferase involved in cell wall biosynthesis